MCQRFCICYFLSGRDSASGATQLDFPNGLPPAPSRKPKDKLTEVEQQLNKAEAAECRRIQNEKAARESEAEAIRKIPGQDSSRKKQEVKLKRRQEELAQAANAKMLAPNTIRTIIGPTGTTVAFAEDIGLPHIFDHKPSSRWWCQWVCSIPLFWFQMYILLHLVLAALLLLLLVGPSFVWRLHGKEL